MCPATRDKHPSQAAASEQYWFMDFGFLHASQFNYNHPDKMKDCVVTIFDGYNYYLIAIDESTKDTWIYLCVSKEQLLNLIHLHLHQAGIESDYIHRDQVGELARCQAFVPKMAERHFIVEPTRADSPHQNKQASNTMTHLLSQLEFCCMDLSVPVRTT